ncbi:MAG: hypothetical protein WBW58_01715 [Candidatus Acidiferrum sp.]
MESKSEQYAEEEIEEKFDDIAAKDRRSKANIESKCGKKCAGEEYSAKKIVVGSDHPSGTSIWRLGTEKQGVHSGQLSVRNADGAVVQS